MEDTVLRCQHCGYCTVPSKFKGKCLHCSGTQFATGRYVYSKGKHEADLVFPPEPPPKTVEGDNKPTL
jgi:hypothetical protein